MKKIIFWIFILIYINIFAIDLKLVKVLMTGNAPKSIQITPDGKYAYVNNLEDCSVWEYDINKRKLIKKIVFNRTSATGYNYQTKDTISSFAEKPVDCDFSDNGKNVWISLHNGEEVVVYNTQEIDSNYNSFRNVTIYDKINNTKKRIKLKSIKTGKTPKVVKVSPDNKWIYVSNWHSDNVTVIDNINKTFVKNIPVIHIPRGIAFSPDSHYVYIANMGDLCVTKIDLFNNHKKIKNIPVGINPRDIHITKDGKYMFITNNIPGKFTKLNLITNKIEKQIEIGKKPRSMILSNDDKYAFVLLYEDNEIAIINTETMEIIKKIKTGLKPIGIAITKNGDELWVTNYYEASLYIYKIIP